MERKVLVTTSFTAACLCFAPMQWVSGSALLVLTVGLYVYDYKRSLKEAAAQEPSAKPPDGEGGEVVGGDVG